MATETVKIEIHKECKWCGRYFSPDRSNQRYCCQDHQIKANNYRRQYGDDIILKPKKAMCDNMKKISAIARAAREEGMSYGKYVAKYLLPGSNS